MEKKPSLVSMSGAPILRHDEATPFETPHGEECLKEISDHIEAHLGPIETVFHELVSDTVHIDVHFIKPTAAFPYIRLVTSGMSDLPMTVPEGRQINPYAELMLNLPGDWKMTQADFEDENWYWPIRLVKYLARLPHKYRTWLGVGHTVPNGDPAEPYAPGTALSGAVVVTPVSVPDAFRRLVINDSKTIDFLVVVPLYSEEMDFKLRKGVGALLDNFNKAGVSDIVDPQRRNVARKRFGIF